MKHILTGRIQPFPIFFEKEDEGGGASESRDKSVHISEGARTFAKKFAPPADVLATAGVPHEKPPKEKVDEPPVGETPEQKAAREAQPPSRQREERRKPGENVPQILEAKRKAEAALAEKDAAVQRFEKETVPGLNKQVADLQAKIDSGDFSPKKEKEFTEKIAAIEKERDEKIDKLTNELEIVRKRNAQLSLPDDPIYKEKYLIPLGQTIEQMHGIVGSNVVMKGALNRVMMAQRAVLEATSTEARITLEGERDQIMDSMLEGMGSTGARRMTSAFEQFLDKSEAQALALAEWEKTHLNLRKEAETRGKMVAKTAIDQWMGEYNAQAPEYDKEAEIPEDMMKEAKELGINYDASAESKFSRGAIEGLLGKADVVKLVHRGRAYSALSLKNKVLEKRLADAEASLARLRGAAPGGGNRDNSHRQPPKPTETVSNGELTRKEWQSKRFAPPPPSSR